VRLVGRAITQEQAGGPLNPAGQSESAGVSRQAYFGDSWGTVDTPVVTRSQVTGTVRGPLLIDEYDSTTVVPPDMQVRLDDEGNIVMSPVEGR